MTNDKFTDVKEVYFIDTDYKEPENPNLIHLFVKRDIMTEEGLQSTTKVVCTFQNIQMVKKFAEDWEWELSDQIISMIPNSACKEADNNIVAEPVCDKKDEAISIAVNEESKSEYSVVEDKKEPAPAVDAAQPIKKRRGRPPRKQQEVVEPQEKE